ncbi:cyclic nucleotide-binding/CBS domain-containing protein [Pseudonocardia acidicola]|uniref:CBS domain-containing protein n=1 Tax=Pseudonocardia acidicola TaxID=2724939 RepID=A0ABX1S7T9_9PSEU|nr:CBS domain-containing protein [Pseudonocardia acidicola]NMH97616.1 CBS domain-containing protein [Pseudonocardia acidicola]
MTTGVRQTRPSDPVRRIMVSPVASVDTGYTVAEVAAELAADEIGAVLVENSHGAVGVVSERDVVTVLGTGGDVDTMQAGDLMSTDMAWVDPEDPISAVAELMCEAGVRHAPVREGGTVVGIVSIRDVLPVYMAGG